MKVAELLGGAARAPRCCSEHGGRAATSCWRSRTTSSGPTAPRPPALEARAGRARARLLAAGAAPTAAGRAAAVADDIVPRARAGGGGRVPRSRSRLSIVTGGPGTGKTATIRMIGAAARAQRASMLLVAPTGRAARRMTESTGLEASHDPLGARPGCPARGRRATRSRRRPARRRRDLDGQPRAAGHAAARGRPATHVVLVGDADQLAPVGAGKPFAELVAAPRCRWPSSRTSSARPRAA